MRCPSCNGLIYRTEVVSGEFTLMCENRVDREPCRTWLLVVEVPGAALVVALEDATHKHQLVNQLRTLRGQSPQPGVIQP